ncbi:GTP pyrophosphokinase [Viridibacillus sp. NPDC093762]|uniref:GTP pyrophosphokinase n=1 Tax=Viridibacillus sp. NPDC093762 TaxID=3390720 RepID=UPI003CFDCBC8
MTYLMEQQNMKELRVELTRFMMAYKFALDEIGTKVRILREEFKLIHEYNPIEHVTTRIKSPESILIKMRKKNIPTTLDGIRENMKDIAGIRITCCFVSDIYIISEMIQAQSDIEVIEVKDYIQQPKPNGYQSLHVILKIPVFMSDREEHVYVEMQIRTIAMDFWASLEHKIYYKYNKQVPERLTNELREAAFTAAELDRKMERLNKEINILKEIEDDEKDNLSIEDTVSTKMLIQMMKKIAIDRLR